MMRRMAYIEWQRKLYTQKFRNEKTRRKRGEHNYRRDCEVHGNLSTVPGDQPWQEYDYRESGGLAGLQRLPGPRHEGNTKKKGLSVIWWSCESARLRTGTMETKRSNLELGGAVRARRSGYNTKVERLGEKPPSIGRRIVKYKHK